MGSEMCIRDSIQIGGFSFAVTTKLTRQTIHDGATLFNDVERKMTYSCSELGIEDVPVRQNLLRNAVEDITHNVITGKNFAERLEAGERSKKHNEAELKELLLREGKPFEYEEELIQAKSQLEEYAELMKKELEEKKLEIKEIQQHCECLESDVNSKVQLDSCLNELLEQYHSMQEDLERRLVERDEEVRRLRNLNLKFILMSSPIYQMLIALCEYNKLNPDGMKKITNDEWVILLHEIDMASLGFVERLSTEYEYLLEEDIRFCCLVRLDFKYADIAYLWGCTSAAVYKRSWSVLEKMGLNKDKKVKLVDILRKV